MYQATCRTLAATLLVSVFALAHATPAQAEKYKFDPNHTNIDWQANHFGFSNPSGKFAKTEGTLELDEDKPENSKVTITIHTDSVVTGIEKFDQHIESADFLDAVKFPTATFISDKVEVTGKETAKVSGMLNLHGVENPVTLEVKLNKIGESPVAHRKTAGFSASTTIKRSEFGINTALPFVSDEVKLSIEAEANVE